MRLSVRVLSLVLVAILPGSFGFAGQEPKPVPSQSFVQLVTKNDNLPSHLLCKGAIARMGIKASWKMLNEVDLKYVTRVILEASRYQNVRGMSFTDADTAVQNWIKDSHRFVRENAKFQEAKVNLDGRIRMLKAALAKPDLGYPTSIADMPPSVSFNDRSISIDDWMGHFEPQDKKELKERISLEESDLRYVKDDLEVDLQINQALLFWKFHLYLEKAIGKEVKDLQSVEAILAAYDQRYRSVESSDETQQRRVVRSRVESIAKVIFNSRMQPEPWATQFVSKMMESAVKQVHGGLKRFQSGAAQSFEFVVSKLDWLKKPVVKVMGIGATITLFVAVGTQIKTGWNDTAEWTTRQYQEFTLPDAQLNWLDHKDFLTELKMQIADNAFSQEQFDQNFYAYFQLKDSDFNIRMAMEYIKGIRDSFEPLPDRPIEKGRAAAAQRIVEIYNALLFGVDPLGRPIITGARSRFEVREYNEDGFKEISRRYKEGEMVGPVKLPEGASPVTPLNPDLK
jgi:hypothetical protein